MTRFPALKNALRALSANKVRTFLTMLGIIIGVGAVVVMVSLGAGAGKSVSGRIQSLGSNLLTVTAGSGGGTGGGARGAIGSGTSITLADSDAIAKEVPEVLRVSPEYSSSAQLVSGNRNLNATVSGVTPAYETVRNTDIEVGRFIDRADLDTAALVAVVGRNLVDDLFAGENPVGHTLRLGRVSVQIVGVMKSKGGAGPNSPDDTIFVPLSTAQKRLFGEDHLRQIGVQVRASEQMQQATDRINLLLMGRHGVSSSDEADFRILNQQNILETMGAVTGIFTLLLGGVASVSLLVGGIGIMNIMLVSVTERTREIGLRKAVGARRADILRQFLTESVTLGLLGGIIGIVVGVGGSALISALASFTTVVTLGSVALAFLFAVGVGVFFGVFPAARAARLDPIEALRHQ